MGEETRLLRDAVEALLRVLAGNGDGGGDPETDDDGEDEDEEDIVLFSTDTRRMGRGVSPAGYVD